MKPKTDFMASIKNEIDMFKIELALSVEDSN